MKLKTLALLAASAIGVNANALDLNEYTEYTPETSGYPTVSDFGYYSNSAGEVFKKTASGLQLNYTLSDSILFDFDGSIAIGHLKDTNASEGNFFLCPIEKCNVIENRTYVPNHRLFLFDTAPSNMASQATFSGHGNAVIKSRISGTDNYTVSVIDMEGTILDGFDVPLRYYSSEYFTSRTLTATTGITREKDFKLLTAGHGVYKLQMKQWDSVSKILKNVSVYTNTGEEINAVYPNGLAPISISDPVLSPGASAEYKVVFAELNSISDVPKVNNILWGNIVVENGEARFKGSIESTAMPTNFYATGLAVSRPIFYEDNTFTFSGFTLDMSSKTVTSTTITKDGKTFNNQVYYKSKAGEISVFDTTDGYKHTIYTISKLGLSTSAFQVDPYLDPSVSIMLDSSVPYYYGIEATCSLQTANATVDSNNYIDLSDTALQIPIEWDAVTGEWKGAQSLTGLESLSGSKDFAQFNLTADVTTGTWTMNCSGIASDIEGNKIELNPAEITINLDDQIHGGSSVISGQIQIPNTTDYSGVVVTITLNGRQIEVTTMEDGSFEFDRLVEGDYTVHVYSEQYVAACNNLTLDGTNAAAPLTIEMYAGDINNDGAVDIGDFSYLSSLYGLSNTDEQYDALADLNHDGIINVQDLSILGSHFGTDHCEVVPE